VLRAMINCRFIGRVLITFAMLLFGIPVAMLYITALPGLHLLGIGLICAGFGGAMLVAGATCLEIAKDE
jgi:hypothetical protein